MTMFDNTFFIRNIKELKKIKNKYYLQKLVKSDPGGDGNQLINFTFPNNNHSTIISEQNDDKLSERLLCDTITFSLIRVN